MFDGWILPPCFGMCVRNRGEAPDDFLVIAIPAQLFRDVEGDGLRRRGNGSLLVKLTPAAKVNAKPFVLASRDLRALEYMGRFVLACFSAGSYRMDARFSVGYQCSSRAPARS
jgi:hypothetical protein